MSEAAIIGIDLAKHGFQLHGARHDGSVVFRKKLSRGQAPAPARFRPFQLLPPSAPPLEGYAKKARFAPAANAAWLHRRATRII